MNLSLYATLWLLDQAIKHRCAITKHLAANAAFYATLWLLAISCVLSAPLTLNSLLKKELATYSKQCGLSSQSQVLGH